MLVHNELLQKVWRVEVPEIEWLKAVPKRIEAIQEDVKKSYLFDKSQMLELFEHL